ncbi:hypothetical protein WS76_27290 [Burkholderia humptydooensis]|nr:hypothetical protein WS76_27290 [Burkholderia humptydooensis]
MNIRRVPALRPLGGDFDRPQIEQQHLRLLAVAICSAASPRIRAPSPSRSSTPLTVTDPRATCT